MSVRSEGAVDELESKLDPDPVDYKGQIETNFKGFQLTLLSFRQKNRTRVEILEAHTGKSV